MPFDAIIQLTHEHLIGYYNQLLTIFYNNPYHVIIETGLTLFIVWLLFIRKTVNPTLESKNRLSAKEQQWLVETWIPEPLVPKITPVDINIVEKVEGNYLMIRGIKGKVLNLNTFDFLGYSRLPAMKAQVQAALEKYGCGSCGPRGFYGTIDVHLEFEKQIALFMGTEVVLMGLRILFNVVNHVTYEVDVL
jgi:serine palmitoyltransferase